MVEQAKRLQNSELEPCTDDEMAIESNLRRSSRRLAASPLKKTRTTSEASSVVEPESDSASLDSVKSQEYTREQLMEYVEEALKGNQKALERVMDDTLCPPAVVREVVGAMTDEESTDLYNLIFNNPNAQFSIYGQARWIRFLLAEKHDVLSATIECRKNLEPFVDRRQSVADQFLRLRGKMDLLLGYSSD